MTHKQLVDIAYKWVLKNGSVGIAFKELKSLSDEIPDVIGFGGWQSVLIECKISRSDFLSDKKKPHRSKGMGDWRYYCCPKGLIKVAELPEKWGLIYVDEKGQARIEYNCRKMPENKFEKDLVSENRIMYTALRRLFIKGYMKFIYDKEYQKGISPSILIALNEFPTMPQIEVNPSTP